ncbi:MAG: peptide chain release factor N(5)-glutamine methyltransferase [Opitutaceae bacterium]|nr:peptide chain release factor N(5)-glutamine methyltransferase [Cephaloticoccus sp.]MCP5530768.1 peptide chain release factor N(5)-glutamine methyltransferase [Opitutaceae bacterium]
MRTVLEIIKMSADFLGGKGVEQPRLNAELMVGHALGLKRMQLYLQFERPLAESELETIRGYLRRRGQREPLQYILGETDFLGLALKTDRRALIPRPETEYLVSLLTEKIGASPRRVLDLGTGTGAIALALATHWPEAQVLATDVSTDALALAQENVEQVGLGGRVQLLQSDWYQQVPADTCFDLIVSNPPYLSDRETDETLVEVKNFEPRIALTPGGHGLESIQRIIAGAPAHLNEGGLLAMETGIAQHEAIAGLLVTAGFSRHEFLPDLTGRPRFAWAWI